MANMLRLSGRLFFFVVCVLWGAAVEAQPESWREVAPGVVYGSYSTTAPLAIHILKVDLTSPHISVEPVPGHGDLHRRERPSELAARVSRPGWRVIAATNGDLGNHKDGKLKNSPAGFFARDGRMMSNASSKASLVLDADGRPHIDHFTTILDLNPAGASTAPPIMVDWLNHWYDFKSTALFTPEYGVSEDWRQPVAEFTLRLPQLPSLGGEPVTVEVLGEALVTTGGTVIHPGQAILQTPLEAPHRAALADPDVKWELRAGIAPVIDGAAFIISGAGQVARDGKVDVTARRERLSAAFAESRHPRTGVGHSADGKTLIMGVVDGRQPDHSIGVSLAELGEIMIVNGAAAALNLDGGGSSCMIVDGVVVNRPSDPGGERAVTSALCVISTAP